MSDHAGAEHHNKAADHHAHTAHGHASNIMPKPAVITPSGTVTELKNQ